MKDLLEVLTELRDGVSGRSTDRSWPEIHSDYFRMPTNSTLKSSRAPGFYVVRSWGYQ